MSIYISTYISYVYIYLSMYISCAYMNVHICTYESIQIAGSSSSHSRSQHVCAPGCGGAGAPTPQLPSCMLSGLVVCCRVWPCSSLDV